MFYYTESLFLAFFSTDHRGNFFKLDLARFISISTTFQNHFDPFIQLRNKPFFIFNHQEPTTVNY